MKHMRAPHTSKHMWTGLVSKLVWAFFLCVVILELGLFCCLEFFVAVAVVSLFYIFNVKRNLKWKDY